MLRWPYKLRWIDGASCRVKYVQGFVRNLINLWENAYIRLIPLPHSGLYTGQPRNEKLIFSLTSFPARIDSAFYAIKSLMRQSVKADRIVLWLAQQQFPDQKLPERFDRLIKRGLEVCFTPDDLKSHKKYFYALQRQAPDEVVITFDDDIIYDPDAVKRLVDLHNLFPREVICNRGSLIGTDKNGELDFDAPWRLYVDEAVGAPSDCIVPSTGAGCLYPVGIMPESTFNKDELLHAALNADDLWIWHNCRRGGIKIVKTQKASRVLCSVLGSQGVNLFSYNIDRGGNRDALDRLGYTGHVL